MKNTIVEFVLCCLAHTSNTIRQCIHCKNQIMHTHEVLILRKDFTPTHIRLQNRLLFFCKLHLTFKYSNVFVCLFIHIIRCHVIEYLTMG